MGCTSSKRSVTTAPKSTGTTSGDSAAHPAAWVGVAPGVHESAGKRTPVGARHTDTWPAAMPVEAAGPVGRSAQDS